MKRVLIIGYGNPLRCDDGVGWHAAEYLRGTMQSDAVEILALHQLTPELAESISRTNFVVFIDARAGGMPGRMQFTDFCPDPTAGIPAGHQMSPRSLLAYTQCLYGHAPYGAIFTISGGSFEYGESLTAPVQTALPMLYQRMATLIRAIVEKRTVLI